MPDLRTNKSIVQRFDVEFNKRPEAGLRRLRRAIGWACVIGPLLLVALYEVLGDGRAYWAGPLTEAHQSALVGSRAKRSEGCAECHTKSAQPLWRLVTGSSRHCSVADENCLKCHFKNDRLDEPERVERARFGHSSLMVEQSVLSCAVCHEEHRGKEQKERVDLKEVADGRCVTCHRHLTIKGDEHSFYERITSFAAHPEFAASRFRGEHVVAGDEPPGPKNSVYERAELQGGKLLVDKTPLYFNHAAHLQHDGVLLAESRHEGVAEEKNVETDTRDLRWKKLECADCHKMDGKEYMLPITFKEHCSRCHPLAYSERINGGGLGPLSHLELSKVYVEARGRLRDFANKQLTAPRGADPADDLPRLPNKQGPMTTPAGSVDELVNSLWPDLREVIHSGCAHCHVLRPSTAAAEGEQAVVPPKIPSRWLLHSKFKHGSHDKYACVSCHRAEWHNEESVLLNGEEGERELPSTRTADILMPSVAVCQKCHVKGSSPPWRIRANADCVECHDYHPHSSAK